MIPEPMFHYYAFSFSGIDVNSGRQAWASCYIGYEVKDKITKLCLKDAKEAAQMTNDAVLISCSYLGYMSNSTFMAGQD